MEAAQDRLAAVALHSPDGVLPGEGPVIQIESFATRMPEPTSRPAPPVTLTLSSGVLEFTQRQLQSLSAGTREALVVWAGRTQGQAALVTHVITPEACASYD